MPSSSSIDYRSFWGKAHPAECGQRWHPLAYHCLDVAAAAEGLIEMNISRPPAVWRDPSFLSPLLALIALHDIGKFSRSFQAKSKECWSEALGSMDGPADPGHGAVGLAMLLDEKFEPYMDGLFQGWPRSERAMLLGALCGHHGRPVATLSLPLHTYVCETCMSSATDFTEALLALFGNKSLPVPDEDDLPVLIWWLAGHTVLADWVGSNQSVFHYEVPNWELAPYWMTMARPRARQALTSSGISPQPIRPRLSIADLVGQDAAPSPLQTLLGTVNIGAEGPILALIEDQTGSGKTEAALLLSHRLIGEGRANGIFVALPTMATANAMYDRLASAYRRLFDDHATPSLALAHSRRADHPGFQASILPNAGVFGQPSAAGAEDESASAQCAAWLADDRRRVFLAHVGVGTIDQALLAVLPTRHAPLRMLGLNRRVLIVDEAHAYDSYMREELIQLIAFQAGLGGCTLVLSATLPSKLRKQLSFAFSKAVRAGRPCLRADGYPLVTILHRDQVLELPVEVSGPPRVITVERLDTIEQARQHVVAAANAGAAVAWVRNAVADASEAHRLLIEGGFDATLFHARFAMGDRQDIEAKVMQRFGKLSTDRAGIVVATPVIEQSLDLDFDIMVTDLAPIDLLIQRAGRVWRHKRDSRPARQPKLLVVSPEPADCPGADWLGLALRRTGRIHEDHALLWLSARVLFEMGEIVAPDGLRTLVESVYGAASEPPSGLQLAAARAEGRANAESALARQNILNWRNGYSLNAGAWENDVRTPTRLGEPSTLFRLARWDGERLRPWYENGAWTLSEIAIPPWIATSVPEPEGRLASAIRAVRSSWDHWTQEIPVLPLTPVGNGWMGTAMRQDHLAELWYTATSGLEVRDR